MTDYVWNPVFNFVMRVKNKYTEITGCDNDKAVNDTGEEENCFYNWLKVVNNEDFNHIAAPLVVKQGKTEQTKNYLHIRYRRYDELFSMEGFDYNSFWVVDNGFYKEARTLVVDVKNDAIVLNGFKKFCNIGENDDDTFENLAKRITENGNSYEVSEKKDGSLFCASYSSVNKNIVFSTSSCIDVCESWRLEEAIQMFSDNPENCEVLLYNPDCTFMYEYISLKDPHIVTYGKDEQGIYLIGMRNNRTGFEYSYKVIYNIAHTYGLKCTNLFTKTVDEIIEDTKRYRHNELEGFVVKVGQYRCKIKTEDYLQMHKVVGSKFSGKTTIRMFAEGKFDDYYASVPNDIKDRVDCVADIIKEYVRLCNEVTNNYTTMCFKENRDGSRKDLILWIQNNVPKFLQGFVINAVIGRENRWMFNSGGGYRKLDEIKNIVDKIKAL